MNKYKDLIYRLILILLLVALTIGLSQAFIQNMIASTEETCWEELSMARKEAAREIGIRLNTSIQILKLAADALTMNADLEDSKAVLDYLSAVQSESIFSRIDVIYPDGAILLQPGQRIAQQGNPDYNALLARGSHLSLRTPDYHTGQESLQAFAPVYSTGGENVALLSATVHCSALSELFTSAHYGNDAQLFLIDRRDGSFVMDNWSPELTNIRDIGDPQRPEEYRDVDFAADCMAGRAGFTAFVSGINGKTFYMVYGPVENTDFTLAMTLQDDIVFAAVSEMRTTMMWAGLFEIVLLLVLSLWLYSMMRKSLRNENRAQQAEIALMHHREGILQDQYHAAADRQEFLETLAINLPGGYHRCTTDHSFRITFISKSFTQVTGYTQEQIDSELNGSYMGIVAPEDREFFMSLAPRLERDGSIHCAYRMLRRDGSIRWVQDSTQYVQRDGEAYYQCALSDIHDIILKQEELARQANMLDTLEKNMPGGYHRCADADGWPFLYISDSFVEVTGWTRQEIREQFDNHFINMVLPEDIPLCAGIIEDIQHRGYSNAMYRLKQKDGGYIWVSDSTMRFRTEDGTFYHGVLADVSVQVEAMERAKQLAEASSHAKSTFLFNISHDIRTPMNAIKGFAHIIKENAEDSRLVLDAVGKIEQAGDSLILLMNDVLDISRIERGKEDLNLLPMDLYNHSRNLYEMFAAEMQEAGIRFLTAGDELRDYIYCDELKLTRIMMNMLSNAKKFTPAGGTVTFGGTRLSRDEKTCTYRFFVRDTGIGMSTEFQKRAFQQFERERTSTESGIAGSGLGLAIIKMLVELMGGRVEIHSELGKGTEISAVLTFALANGEPLQAEIQEQHATDMSGRHILLVEDNDFNREIARYILEGMQFSVDEAENGAVCIEKLMASAPGQYDLILMDIQMPVMDGYTAAMEIRNLPDVKKASVPIVAMTANAFEEDKRKCLEAGMNGHIGKPIDMLDLTRVLSGIFNEVRL